MADKKNRTTEVVAGVTTLALDSWLAMLLVGGIHSDVSRVPALGYSTVAGALLIVRLVYQFASWDWSSRSE